MAGRDMAKLLKKYGIRSKDIRSDAVVRKGYEKNDFTDAFSRYVISSATSATPDMKQASKLSATKESNERVVADENSGVGKANVALVAANPMVAGDKGNKEWTL